MDNKAIYQYLSGFLTEERKSLFEKLIQLRTRYMSVLLEDVHHPHNVNAVLRSCECFGLCDMHVLESRYSYEESLRIARGSGKWTEVVRHQNLRQAVEQLKNNNYKIVAATPGNTAISVRELPIDQAFVLVFGAEKRGLSKEAEELADFHMQIPMQGFTESLNVSVAAALSLYELTWRIRNSNYPWQLSETEKYALLVDWSMKSVRSAEDLMKVYREQHGK